MENELKQINKAYAKKLNKVNGLNHFIEYLKYLRDSIVIKTGSAKALECNSAAVALIVTLNEFDAYKNSKEEKQRKFHWDNFWEFVKLNMEEWLVLNDSV